VNGQGTDIVKHSAWVISLFALSVLAGPGSAYEGSPQPILGDEMSDAMVTSSVTSTADKSCRAEMPKAMNTARGFDIFSAIAPKQSTAEEATP
jgi:hypothetical protein